jgi:hypothetical protein
MLPPATGRRVAGVLELAGQALCGERRAAHRAAADQFRRLAYSDHRRLTSRAGLSDRDTEGHAAGDRGPYGSAAGSADGLS